MSEENTVAPILLGGVLTSVCWAIAFTLIFQMETSGILAGLVVSMLGVVLSSLHLGGAIATHRNKVKSKEAKQDVSGK